MTGSQDRLFGRWMVKAITATTSQVAVSDLRTMVWSHHWPDDHQRCVQVRGKAVCRRCLVLYPLALAMLVLSLAGFGWPARFDTLALFMLPLPVVVDFVGEQLGVLRYSARRQVVTTAFAALALGRSFGRYLDHHGDTTFWSMAMLYGGLCGFTVLCRHARDARLTRRRDERELLADPLAAGFGSREAFLEYLSVGPRDSSVQITGTEPVSSSVTN